MVLTKNPGKVLYRNTSGVCFKANKFTLYKGNNEGITWKKLTEIPANIALKIITTSRLMARMLRFEIRAMIEVGKNLIIVTKEQIYWYNTKDGVLHPAIVNCGDLPYHPAINLGIGPNNQIVWGEYWNNRERRKVRIFGSKDHGRSYSCWYEFPAGEIRHVHNILYDPELRKYWVFCGDHGHEPGIGLIAHNFQNFEWVHKGKQKYRAVQAFLLQGKIIYATDTEMETNAIYEMDKFSWELRKITDTDGSCINATKCKDYYVISTSVEPLKNQALAQDNKASLWVSKNAYDWHRIKSFEKDRWDTRYFQFGSIILPAGESNSNELLFSGQALKEIDGKVKKLDLDKLEI
jgi:hypothetical protein